MILIAKIMTATITTLWPLASLLLFTISTTIYIIIKLPVGLLALQLRTTITITTINKFNLVL